MVLPQARALGLPQSFYTSLVAVFGTFSQHIPLTMLCTFFSKICDVQRQPESPSHHKSLDDLNLQDSKQQFDQFVVHDYVSRGQLWFNLGRLRSGLRPPTEFSFEAIVFILTEPVPT